MFDPFFQAFSWLLSAFYSLVPNYGFAIAMLTLVVYGAMFPLTLKQTRSMLAQSRLQPELARLKKEHKGDLRAFGEAQQALFAREGINPAASCLPMFLQIPLFIILWQVLSGLTRKTPKGIPDPKYLEHTSKLYRDIVADGGELVSFGVDLAKSAVGGPHASFAGALPYFLMAVLAAATTYMQLKRSQGRNPAAGEGMPGMQMMTKFFPMMTLMSGVYFPAGLGLYILISNLFRITQQEAMYRWDPHVVHHAKVAAETRASVTDTTAKPKQRQEPKKQAGPGEKSATNGSDPSPVARDSGRAQPKGTRGRSKHKKKSRR